MIHQKHTTFLSPCGLPVNFWKHGSGVTPGNCRVVSQAWIGRLCYWLDPTCTRPTGFRRSWGYPKPCLQPRKGDGTGRHRQSLHLAIRVRCPAAIISMVLGALSIIYALWTICNPFPLHLKRSREWQIWYPLMAWCSIDCHAPTTGHPLLWQLFPLSVAPSVLLVHTTGWVPHEVILKTQGTFFGLGWSTIHSRDSSSLSPVKQKLLGPRRALSIKWASARTVIAAISKRL